WADSAQADADHDGLRRGQPGALLRLDVLHPKRLAERRLKVEGQLPDVEDNDRERQGHDEREPQDERRSRGLQKPDAPRNPESTRNRSRIGKTTTGLTPALLARRTRNGNPSTVRTAIAAKAERIEVAEALELRVVRATASGMPPPSRSPTRVASQARAWLTANSETRSASALTCASSGPLKTSRTVRARAKLPAARTATSGAPAIDSTSEASTARRPLPRRKAR